MSYLETATAIWASCSGGMEEKNVVSDLGYEKNEITNKVPPLSTSRAFETGPTWDDIRDLQWGPEFDDPMWDRAKGLLKAMRFSGFAPTIEGNRLVVTETRGLLTDDDRAEIARFEADLIPLIRAL